MKDQTFYIGIDGGGTNCRARLEDADGKLLATGSSGSANVMRCLDTAKLSIMEACQRALKEAQLSVPLDQIIVGAGLAGANVPSALDAVQSWQHPFKTFHVISDLHAACIGAHAGEEGAAIISGTGTSGTRFYQGEFTDFGGHGFGVGDIGSGAWLGLSAVQHTLQVLDGIYPVDELTQAVCGHLSVSAPLDLVQKIADFNAKDFAAIAPIVVSLQQKSEPSSQKLFNDAIYYLEKLAQRLLANSDIPLCLIGGLSSIYQQYFSHEVRSRIRGCMQSPEQGAIYHVKQILNVGV